MSQISSVELLVYPDDCDSFGHVNQATFLRLFEHARWQAVAAGPGMDVFERTDAWPAVRKTTIEYYAGAFPGDKLRFEFSLTDLGRTSFTVHQSATRDSDNVVVAEADLLFVCLKRDGTPTPVPGEVADFLGGRRPTRPSGTQQLLVRGVSTGFEAQGDGNAVLFIHGFPMDRTMWSDLVSTLTGWRRIAPDLRGMGSSDGPPTGYSMVDYADDLAALLDVLDVERAAVCGLSMGGYVAFEFLRRHRERVRGLMLLNTRADSDSPETKQDRDEMIAAVRRDGVAVLGELLIHRLLAPDSIDAMPHLVERLEKMLQGHSMQGVVGAIEAMKGRTDYSGVLSHIDVPTLVVAGREDRLISVDRSQALASAIPDAQFTVIGDAGHVTPMEQPIATGRVIREFLESID